MPIHQCAFYLANNIRLFIKLGHRTAQTLFVAVQRYFSVYDWF